MLGGIVTGGTQSFQHTRPDFPGLVREHVCSSLSATKETTRVVLPGFRWRVRPELSLSSGLRTSYTRRSESITSVGFEPDHPPRGLTRARHPQPAGSRTVLSATKRASERLPQNDYNNLPRRRLRLFAATSKNKLHGNRLRQRGSPTLRGPPTACIYQNDSLGTTEQRRGRQRRSRCRNPPTTR
jgi:hypothetical protein